MTHDPFRQLLQDAELSAVPPRPAGVDFPAAIRRRLQRRQNIRRRTIGVAVLLLAGGLVSLHLRPRQKIASVVPQATPQELRAQIAALDQTATLHALTAQKLLAMEHSQRLRDKLKAAERSDPLAEIQFQRDRAALTLVYQADRLMRQKEPGQAIAAYRRAIQLFPESRWAAVARQKLIEIKA